MPPHGDDCTGHSHDSEFGDEAALTSLRELIDLPRVTCLNEEAEGTGRAVLRSHGDRYVTEPRLRSTEDPDDEPELILHVPFTEAVAVRTISIEGAPPASSSGNGGGSGGGSGSGGGGGGGSGSAETSAPRTVKLFVNRDDLDFETARQLEPAMVLDLLPPEHGVGLGTIDYPLRPAGRFQGAASVTLYFPDNYAREADPDGDAVQTEITYVGFKGKGTRVKRRAVDAVYESRGMKEDHKVPDGEMGAHHGFLS